MKPFTLPSPEALAAEYRRQLSLPDMLAIAELGEVDTNAVMLDAFSALTGGVNALETAPEGETPLFCPGMSNEVGALWDAAFAIVNA